MITSDQIDQLATALAAAQAVIEGADKGNTNPHFKSKYADLASVWDACRKPLTDNGLSVVQALGSNGDSVTCTTMLLHKSGQYIRSVFEMTPAQKTPQAAGSCATYLRRYSLQAIVGVAPEDDDGNEASSKGPQKPVVQNPVAAKAPQVKRDVAPPASQVVMFDEGDTTHAKAVMQWCEQKQYKNVYRSMIEAMKGQPFTRVGFDTAWAKVNPEAPDKEPDNV
jgi:hypothetical protein